MRNSVLLIFSLLVVYGCAKLEGEGGRSVLQGKVYEINYSQESAYNLDTFPAVDKKVFIVYGSGSIGDDDVQTNASGSYQFGYLRKGNYAVYTYSDDPYGSDNEIPVQVTVSVGENKGTYSAQDIYIYKTKGGSSVIKGTVKAALYATDEDLAVDTVLLGDEDVFVVNLETGFFDDVKTDDKGRYVFSNLWPGVYEVYFYENDTEQGEIDKKVSVIVEVNAISQVVDVGEVVLFKSDEGMASISGYVEIKELDPVYSFPFVYSGAEEDVFLKRLGFMLPVERVKANDEGWYVFPRLRTGTYVVYSYSDVVGASKKNVVSDTIYINELKQSVVADTIKLLRI